MKVFTIDSGNVIDGAIVETLTIKGTGFDVPALIVGEIGHGCERGVIPVQLTHSQYMQWQKNGIVDIQFAEIGKTKAGKPKLFSKDEVNGSKGAICVFHTEIGTLGSNDHTGDRIDEEVYEDGGVTKMRLVFDPFPGEILVSGTVTREDAGLAGSGRQLIAVIPKGCIFRTAYGNRSHNMPTAHYYLWNGWDVIGGLTWDERRSGDVF